MSEKQLPSWISFRVKPEEYEKIHTLFSQSAHRKLSEYARKLLLQKPVVIKTRNESADELLACLLALKNELNAIGNNYNQVVRKLHTLNHIEEVKAWLILHERIYNQIIVKSEELFLKMNEILQLWS